MKNKDVIQSIKNLSGNNDYSSLFLSPDQFEDYEIRMTAEDITILRDKIFGSPFVCKDENGLELNLNGDTLPDFLVQCKNRSPLLENVIQNLSRVQTLVAEIRKFYQNEYIRQFQENNPGKPTENLDFSISYEKDMKYISLLNLIERTAVISLQA